MTKWQRSWRGRLGEAMRKAGIRSARELARLAGASYVTVARVVAQTHSPHRVRGKGWRNVAWAVCNALRVDPEDMRPEYAAVWPPADQCASLSWGDELRGVAAEQLGPYDACGQADERQALSREVDALPARAREVLELRPWRGLTPTEVGRRFGVTRESVRQVEAKALRMLRRPARIKRLQSATGRWYNAEGRWNSLRSCQRKRQA